MCEDGQTNTMDLVNLVEACIIISDHEGLIFGDPVLGTNANAFGIKPCDQGVAWFIKFEI